MVNTCHFHLIGFLLCLCFEDIALKVINEQIVQIAKDVGEELPCDIVVELPCDIVEKKVEVCFLVGSVAPNPSFSNMKNM